MCSQQELANEVQQLRQQLQDGSLEQQQQQQQQQQEFPSKPAAILSPQACGCAGSPGDAAEEPAREPRAQLSEGQAPHLQEEAPVVQQQARPHPPQALPPQPHAPPLGAQDPPPPAQARPSEEPAAPPPPPCQLLQELARLRRELAREKAEGQAARELAEDACLQLHVAEAAAESAARGHDERLAAARLRAWEARLQPGDGGLG